LGSANYGIRERIELCLGNEVVQKDPLSLGEAKSLDINNLTTMRVGHEYWGLRKDK
jgi:hypothetical protein